MTNVFTNTYTNIKHTLIHVAVVLLLVHYPSMHGAPPFAP